MQLITVVFQITVMVLFSIVARTNLITWTISVAMYLVFLVIIVICHHCVYICLLSGQEVWHILVSTSCILYLLRLVFKSVVSPHCTPSDQTSISECLCLRELLHRAKDHTHADYRGGIAVSRILEHNCFLHNVCMRTAHQ